MVTLRIFVLAALALAFRSALPQPARIFLEGEFSDWQNRAPLYQDTHGDFGADGIDFQNLWMTNDERSLFLRLQLGQSEISMQNSNAIVMYLDTDNSLATGLPIQGIGAELEWRFGARRGTFYSNGHSFPILQNDIGIITAPTVSSTEFEIRLDRFATPANGASLFRSDSIGVAFASLGDNGDHLPDPGQRVLYSFDDTPLPALPPLSIQRQNPNSLRLLSYNVNFDRLFEVARIPSFARILRALAPDIIGLQEVFSHTAEETARQIAAMLPLWGTNERWYASKAGPDNVVVSRYPITQTFEVEGNGAFVIDLRPHHDSDVLLFVAHPPCCTNDDGRQFEIDAMMAFIRDAKAGSGALALEANTPIILMGDFNLVGDSQQLQTLLTGDIVNTAQFGERFAPDWDGSNFTDMTPRHLASPMFFTWIQPNSDFSPGRLDFMIYSNSVLEVTNRFVLFTPELPADTLSTYNLHKDDTEATNASDHLPVVGDFVLEGTTRVGSGNYSARLGIALAQNHPNPFNPTTTITYFLPSPEFVTLQVFDVRGRLIATLVRQQQVSGRHSIEFDGDGLPSGLYFYQLRTPRFVKTDKLMLIQ